MHLIRAIALVVVSTFLLTFSSIAIALAAPTRADSRDVLVVSLFAAGIGFALLAGIELWRLHRTLRIAAA
jgi:heme/copper-type cytochrome/quinol oxidase subunit 3